MNIVNNKDSQNYLVEILLNAYSGELAAALAYKGHWKSLKNSVEIAKIQQIENEEWKHRHNVGLMLIYFGEKPNKFKEVKCWFIGTVIGIGCHLIGWFLPMYFAGKLESNNTMEYENAAKYAHDLNLIDFENELILMSVVEKEHELFFLHTVSNHKYLPIMKKIFHWGSPNALLTTEFESKKSNLIKK
ncbi:MAG: ferritin-like domain-containing protein [Blastocatellia bacterium]|nr:ferritin-like domain-containing protein [Blastocatellia bacterium]